MRNLTLARRLTAALFEDDEVPYFAAGVTGQRGDREGRQDKYHNKPKKAEVGIDNAVQILASLVKTPPPANSEQMDVFLEILDLLDTFKDRLVEKPKEVKNFDYEPSREEKIESALRDIQTQFDREHIRPLEKKIEQAHTSTKGKLKQQLEQEKRERDRQLAQYRRTLEGAFAAQDTDLSMFNLEQYE